MKTVTVELLNDKAEELLNNLEAMNIIRIDHVNASAEIKRADKPVKLKPSDYFGILTKKEGEELLNYVNESRKEWERDI